MCYSKKEADFKEKNNHNEFIQIDYITFFMI